ncbi:MAG TPA: hypothetical protein VN802_16420 [Stellaceae bacterium]|nr:hypothetical protein [Stellaceae bacterium]
MRRIVTASLVAAALGACAVAPEPSPQVSGSPNTPPSSSDGGAAVLAAVGTPILIIGKIPVCILTVVMAAPIGAVSEVSDPNTDFGHRLRQGLGDGIAQNCGPPYAVTP